MNNERERRIKREWGAHCFRRCLSRSEDNRFSESLSVFLHGLSTPFVLARYFFMETRFTIPVSIAVFGNEPIPGLDEAIGTLSSNGVIGIQFFKRRFSLLPFTHLRVVYEDGSMSAWISRRDFFRMTKHRGFIG